MPQHRSKAIVSGDGSITVRGLPFREGEQVDVVVVPHHSKDRDRKERRPLVGSVRRYDDPLEPATDSGDWESA